MDIVTKKSESQTYRKDLIYRIKLILKSVREFKRDAIIAPICISIEAFLDCTLPYHMSLFINHLEEMGTTGSFSFEPITGLIIAMVLNVIISIACGVLGGIFASRASTGLAKNLRSDLYEKIESFSFGNIDKFSAASLITRITTDVTDIQLAFLMSIREIIRAPLMLVFSAIMAFMTGGYMAFIFVALVPVTLFLAGIVIVKAFKIFKKVFIKYDKLNESVEENVSGIRVVKSYVREEFESKKFTKASNEMKVEFIKGEKLAALGLPLLNTVIHISNILVLALGSAAIIQKWNVGTKDFSVGQLSALITYGIQILMSLMLLSIVMVTFAISLEGVNRVGEVLIEETQIKNPQNPLMEVKDGSVTFNNVNFKYQAHAKEYTLKNINLNIKSGEFIGIIGATGSGKTSLINLISRLYDIVEGEVLVAGENVKKYDLVTLRDNVAVVLQKNVLFSGTIIENLKWGDENATMDEMVNACKISQADEFIRANPKGYEKYIEQGGTNVSGGQKQRICIARAILKKPKILILDDSTSAVDTKTDILIRKGLRESLPNTTKIVIAQRISSIEDADQIIVMDKGEINAIGKHEDLLKNNKIYQEVYYSQNRIGGNQNEKNA